MSTCKQSGTCVVVFSGIKGRGEYVRLCFEEAGVPYVDVGSAAGDRKEGGDDDSSDFSSAARLSGASS